METLDSIGLIVFEKFDFYIAICQNGRVTVHPTMPFIITERFEAFTLYPMFFWHECVGIPVQSRSSLSDLSHTSLVTLLPVFEQIILDLVSIKTYFDAF